MKTPYHVSSLLLLSSVLAAQGALAAAQQSSPPVSKYQPWEEYYAANRSSLQGYMTLSPEVIQALNPVFNGKYFVITNYNQDTYRWVTNTMTQFSTNTAITTNLNTTTNTVFNTQTLFNTTSALSSMTRGDWIAARANYLQVNFGFDAATSMGLAISDEAACASNPSVCLNLGLTTDYQFVNFGPNVTTTTTNNTTTATTTSGPVNTTTVNGNSTTVTTVSSTTVTNTNTNTRVQTSSQGTQDIVTNASGAGGGSVTTTTTTDTRTDVDTTTTTTTTTDSTTATKTDTTTTTTTQERQKGPRRWNFSIAPIIFFDFQMQNKLVSNNTHFNSVSSTTVNEDGSARTVLVSGKTPVVVEDSINDADVAEYPRLKVGPQNGSFRLSQRRSYTVGIGVAGAWTLQNASGIARGVSPYVGFVPITGSTILSEQMVRNSQEAASAKALDIPLTAASIKNWRLLDKVTYSTRGGVMFTAGVGVYGVSVGTNLVATGEWITEVQKIDNTKVYVKLTNSLLESFGFQQGAGLVSLSQNYFKNSDSGFSYMLDLSDKRAAAAYENLVKGYAVDAQKLADNPKVTSVIRVESANSVAKGRLNSVGIGVPFIGWNWTKGELHSANTVEFHPDQSKSEADYGIYMNVQDSRFFNQAKNRTYGFYGVAYKNTDKKGAVEQADFGQIGWSYQKNDATHYDLRSAIKSLVRATGMKNELYVEVPETDSRLDYVNVEFGMQITPVATQVLLDIASSKAKLDALNKISQDFIKAYFTPQVMAAEWMYNDVCADHGWEVPRCIDEMTRETRSAVADMQEALRAMRQARGKDRKEYVAQYAKFGRAMLKNQFTFQTIFNLLKGRGVTAKYNISGTQVASYDLSFDWKPEIKKAAVAARR